MTGVGGSSAVVNAETVRSVAQMLAQRRSRQRFLSNRASSSAKHRASSRLELRSPRRRTNARTTWRSSPSRGLFRTVAAMMGAVLGEGVRQVFAVLAAATL